MVQVDDKFFVRMLKYAIYLTQLIPIELGMPAADLYHIQADQINYDHANFLTLC